MTLVVDRLAAERIQEQWVAASIVVLEIEHLNNGVGIGVKRSGDAFTVQPIVFDEPQDRSLIRDRVVHEVFPGPWRDDQQGQARTVPATSLSMQIAGIGSR